MREEASELGLVRIAVIRLSNRIRSVSKPISTTEYGETENQESFRRRKNEYSLIG